MKVYLKYFGTIREALGTAEDEIKIENNATLKDLIQILTRKYAPIFSELIQDNSVVILINGRSAFANDGLNTILSDGSRITMISAYAGG